MQFITFKQKTDFHVTVLHKMNYCILQQSEYVYIKGD